MAWPAKWRLRQELHVAGAAANVRTYLTNAPGTYGAASVYHSAQQLGHSVRIAEAYHLGRERGIPAALEAKVELASFGLYTPY